MLIQKPVALALKIASPRLLVVVTILAGGALVVIFSIAAIYVLNVGYKYGKGIIIAPAYSIMQMLFPVLGSIVIYREWQSMPIPSLVGQASGLLLIVLAMGLPSLSRRATSDKTI